MKNPLTPSGIEPATFRFVAQHRNHCATLYCRSAAKIVHNRMFAEDIESERDLHTELENPDKSTLFRHVH